MRLIWKMWWMVGFFYNLQFDIAKGKAKQAGQNYYIDTIKHKKPTTIRRKDVAELYVLSRFSYRFKKKLPITDEETNKIKKAQTILDSCLEKKYLLPDKEDPSEIYLNPDNGMVFRGFVGGLLTEWARTLKPIKSFFVGSVFGSVSTALAWLFNFKLC